MKFKLTLAFLFILFHLINPSSFSQIENNIKLIYARSESRDVLKAGDETGTRIILYFDGRIEKYSIVFGIGDILSETRKLNQNEINSIDRIFSEYNFSDYPDKIPMVKTPMWPSSSTAVKYRACQECKLKTFAYSSNSERKYLPYNCYEFINELKGRLFSYF